MAPGAVKPGVKPLLRHEPFAGVVIDTAGGVRSTLNVRVIVATLPAPSVTSTSTAYAPSAPVHGTLGELQSTQISATPFFVNRQRVRTMSASPTQPTCGMAVVTQLPSPGVGAVNSALTLLSTKYVREESPEVWLARSTERAATVT